MEVSNPAKNTESDRVNLRYIEVP
ncbi:hypothetical protein NTGM5_290012 [Candidatus Nitrotoga sp. M5]|nr:hypothetical protein NTGM5_290012 [Candidatus Nitrotoga sp. M5]